MRSLGLAFPLAANGAGASGGPWLLGAGLVAMGALAFVWWRQIVRSDLDELEELLTAHGVESETGTRKRILRTTRDLPRISVELRQLAGRLDEEARSARADVLGLELAHARLLDVLHSMSEGVVVVDPVGEILIANRSAREILHLDEFAIGQEFLACLPAKDMDRLGELLLRISGGSAFERVGVVEFGAKSCELTFAPLRHDAVETEEGDPLGSLLGGCVVLMHDVTDAQQAQRMKDEFLSSISHELRTPLTSIRSYAEILLHMTPDDEQTWKEFLGIVNIEAERLTRLVNEVLDLAKMEAGEMEFQFEALDVRPLVETVVAVFAPILEDKDVELKLDCPELLPAIWADHDRLQQVLTNLLGNAAKFVGMHGQVRLTVFHEDETAQLQFVLEDDGPGIPEEQRERVFQKFKQVSSEGLLDKPKGTGLGLPLCRQMLQAMGGEIWCDASPDLGGAAFRFRVPISVETARRW